MPKTRKTYIEVTGASSYTSAEVDRLCKSMRDFVENTSVDEKRDFFRKAGIINKSGKLTKEYGG